MSTSNGFLSWAKTDARILVLGSHDAAEPILDLMKSGPVDNEGKQWWQPQIRVRQYGNAKFTSLHVGGRCPRRPIYKGKLHNTDAVMCAIGKRRVMVAETRKDLHDLFGDELQAGVPVLVVVDKDNPQIENFPKQIEDRLKLDKLKGIQWNIVVASTLYSDEGLQKGLEWLDRAIYEHNSKSVISKQIDKVTTDTTDKSVSTTDATDKSVSTTEATDKCVSTTDATDKSESTTDATDKNAITTDTTEKVTADWATVTTKESIFEQYAKKSLASLGKIFLVNVEN